MTIGIQAFAELLDHSQKIAKFFMVLSIRLLDFIDGYLSRELICNAITLSCPSSRPVAQKTGDINGTSPSDLFQQLLANWQQQPLSSGSLLTILPTESPIKVGSGHLLQARLHSLQLLHCQRRAEQQGEGR